MFDQSKLADVLVSYKQNFVSKQWGEEKIQVGGRKVVSGQLGCESS